MSDNFYSRALLQQMLYTHNIRQLEQLQSEISSLKAAIYNKQKKHRRCDKQISKIYNCAQCERVYASDVALKLHLKLKHAGTGGIGGIGEKVHEEKSTSQNLEELENQLSPDLGVGLEIL